MQEIDKTASPSAERAQNAPPVFMVRGRPINPWLVLLSLVFGIFMSLLDATIVNIAIPTIQTKLQADLPTVSWVLNAYNLVFAVLLVTAGRFADQYGRKRLFMIGMVIFSIGSLLCALAESVSAVVGYPAINWLIGFRALQSVGSAALNPVSLAIIINVFPANKRGAAIGVWGALSGLAAAAGPVLGGFLVQNFDWRWIFFVNLPFCIVGLIMAALFVPETRDPRVSKRIDLAGLITLTVFTFCLLLAIIQGNDWGWTSTPILALFGGALLGLLLFIVVELRQAEPIMDFSLFKALSFSGSNVTVFLFGIAVQGAFLILVLYFINARGYTQLEAAYATLPIPVASFIVAAFAGRFSQRLNPQVMAVLGMAALVAGLALFYTLDVDSPYFDIAWRSVLVGLGMGLTFQSLPNIVLSETPRAKLGVGSGVFNTSRQIGFTLGVAILISVFTGQLSSNLTQARTNAIAIVQADTKIPAQLRDGIVSGLKNSAAAGSRDTTARNVDLSPLADRLPPQVPAQTREGVRTELKQLSDRIGKEFRTQVVNSFRAAWLVAASIGVLGLAAAFLARVKRHYPNPGEIKPPSEGASISMGH